MASISQPPREDFGDIYLANLAPLEKRAIFLKLAKEYGDGAFSRVKNSCGLCWICGLQTLAMHPNTLISSGFYWECPVKGCDTTICGGCIRKHADDSSVLIKKHMIVCGRHS